jgi:long-chain acyl-CoA synthetase
MIAAGAMLTYRNQLMASLSYYETAACRMGRGVVACVVPHAGKTVSTSELDGLCLASIARCKRPPLYVFLDALPKNNYGKVLKKELRKNYGAAERA